MEMIDLLNYQPLCGELECGPMDLAAIRVIQIVFLAILMIFYICIEWIGRDE